MSKVLFSYLTTGATVSYCHAIAALSGELMIDGWDRSDISVLRLDGDPETYRDRVLAVEPAIVLLSVMSNQWQRAASLAHSIREAQPRTIIGIGGSHAIADPGTVVHENVFDFVVAGEADKDIAGLCRKYLVNHEGFQHTQVHPGRTTESLDDLARPAVDLFSRADVLEYPSVIFSRGCPYRCTYCMSRKGGIGGKVRWKSPERALTEVQDLCAYAAPEILNFDDDTLLKNPSWLRSFLGLYQRKVQVPFHCNARPETVTPELARLLKDAGCAAIGIGIESGSARIRADILQRPMTDERIVRAFDLAHEAGLRTWSFNMIGLPTETTEDIEATIALNKRCHSDWLRVSVYTPYPGTPLADSMGLLDFGQSYFRSVTGISEESRVCASDWLLGLAQSGQLWYTKSELDMLLQELNYKAEDTR